MQNKINKYNKYIFIIISIRRRLISTLWYFYFRDLLFSTTDSTFHGVTLILENGFFKHDQTDKSRVEKTNVIIIVSVH